MSSRLFPRSCALPHALRGVRVLAALAVGALKARQACASLRPKGGFGDRGGFGTALQAFRTCMAGHGEAIPATRPTARPSPEPSASPRADRFLNGLNPGNPKVAAAVQACKSKLPTFARPRPSPTG